MYTYIHIYIHTYIHIYIYTSIHIYICNCVGWGKKDLAVPFSNLKRWKFTSCQIHTYMHVCTCGYIRAHTHIHAHMLVCM